MGLRCLLGHDFDEPEIEREREEDGNEVVTTVREVKTCSRCGETQVVSENTEVTTVERLADHAAAAADSTEPEHTPPEDAGAAGRNDVGAPGPAETIDDAKDEPVAIDDAEDEPVTIDDAEAADSVDESAVTTEGEPDDGAEIIDAGPADAPGDDEPTATTADTVADDGGGTGSAGAADVTAPDDPTDADTESDDGVILDEEPSEDAVERDRGAWPEVDDDEESVEDPTPWPETSGADEGFDAEVGGGDSGVEFGGGLTPESAEEPVDVDDETEFVEAPDADASPDRSDSRSEESEPVDTGIASGESPELRTRGEEVHTEYYCPSCEMTRSADGNSMRAGDICPECKRGYVDERPR